MRRRLTGRLCRGNWCSPPTNDESPARHLTRANPAEREGPTRSGDTATSTPTVTSGGRATTHPFSRLAAQKKTRAAAAAPKGGGGGDRQRVWPNAIHKNYESVHRGDSDAPSSLERTTWVRPRLRSPRCVGPYYLACQAGAHIEPRTGLLKTPQVRPGSAATPSVSGNPPRPPPPARLLAQHSQTRGFLGSLEGAPWHPNLPNHPQRTCSSSTKLG